MIADMDNDLAATKALTEPIIAGIPASAAKTLTENGWAQFCASIMLGYGDNGFMRRGLVRKVP